MADDNTDREARLRRTAGTLGYTLLKSSTPVNPQNKGGYMLLRDQALVLGDYFGLSLDEVDAFLEVESAKHLSSEPDSGRVQ